MAINLSLFLVDCGSLSVIELSSGRAIECLSRKGPSPQYVAKRDSSKNCTNFINKLVHVQRLIFYQYPTSSEKILNQRNYYFKKSKLSSGSYISIQMDGVILRREKYSTALIIYLAISTISALVLLFISSNICDCTQLLPSA